MTDKARIHILSDGKQTHGSIVYWMSRDQRIDDNWALVYCQEKALTSGSSFEIVFCLSSTYPGANIRHYHFMINGLKETAEKASRKNIPFTILVGEPSREISNYINNNNVSLLVSDFDPLKTKRIWKNSIIQAIDIPFHEVDAHNIVPCRYVSGKAEYGAYTLRPKINRLLDQFLVEIPSIRKQDVPGKKILPVDWENIWQQLKVDKSVSIVSGVTPGSIEGLKQLKTFVTDGIIRYNEDKNNPVLKGTSRLSPYLHFGQVSAQRIAIEVIRGTYDMAVKQAFLEELIIRRELSDNFCFYNEQYDSIACFPEWAKKSLAKHEHDTRLFLYTIEELEQARTHEALWNAAQKSMVINGYLHGYLRMYWAKKILEWSNNASEAYSNALYLNDKYQLDGRDPNGYAGCAWSIGGVHDRAWPEREVFGNIRYMNEAGCKRKFNIRQYISGIKEK